MIKIHIPPIEKFELQTSKGEYNHILKDGIRLNSKTVLVDNADIADYVFLDFRHLNNRSGYDLANFRQEWISKTVIIDYADSDDISTIPVTHYFKRSVVDKRTHSFKHYNRVIHPISYCVKNNCLNFEIKPILDREYDISIFFRMPHLVNKHGMNNRALVAQFINDTFKHKKIWVGIAGEDGENGRMNNTLNDYYKIMLNSKIVVNCNPDLWEGDYRLFEALSCGSLVMSDPMITPTVNPLIHKTHLVYYDSLEMLKSHIEYYLTNLNELDVIAQCGYNYAITHHTASNRIDEILNIIHN
jgi:spore maturation protein CgeB